MATKNVFSKAWADDSDEPDPLPPQKKYVPKVPKAEGAEASAKIETAPKMTY